MAQFLILIHFLFILVLSTSAQAITPETSNSYNQYLDLKKQLRLNRSKLRALDVKFAQSNTVTQQLLYKNRTQTQLSDIFKTQQNLIKKNKNLLSQMIELENKISVQVISVKLGEVQSKLSLLKELKNQCQSIENQDGQLVLFKDDISKKIVTQFPQMIRRAILQNPYLQNCAKKIKNVPFIKVKYRSQFLCENPNIKHSERMFSGSDVEYMLGSDHKGTPVVKSEIYFKYKGVPKNKEQSLTRLQEQIPCIEQIFAQSGIDLRLSFKYATTKNQFIKAVYLWDKVRRRRFDGTMTDRKDSQNWGAFFSSGHYLLPFEVCSSTAHELAHKFGLPDRYQDPLCLDRETVTDDPNDLMANALGDPLTLSLGQVDLKTILEPLCGK